MNREEQVGHLIERGVRVMNPGSLDVAPEVAPERIAPGTILHAGVRLRGAGLSIGPGCVIGEEGLATLDNCRLERNVELKSGYFAESVFFAGANVGGNAHVRPGTILEEEASAAHAVGLKQTILFPFVTAGSLINFCDALMAGGTSRKDHSEIGSSYVHFNFTPHQDKATPSLIGDVPRGVRLDQPPIFLGGQGGLVGPVRVEYGTVIPAGYIVRQDILSPGHVYAPPHAPPRSPRPFVRGLYRSLRRLVTNNFIYLGNLHALRRWYERVRRPAAADSWTAACVVGALDALDLILRERARRLRETVERVCAAMRRSARELEAAGWSAAIEAEHRLWRDHGAEAIDRAEAGPDGDVGAAACDRFLAAWEKADRSAGYIAAIQALPSDVRNSATDWLQAVVDAVSDFSPFKVNPGATS